MPNISEETKKRLLREHLAYEIDMFNWASWEIGKHIPQINSAMIEVFVLHTRTLIDFFYGVRIKPDDVIASDYVEDWGQKRPNITELLDRARKKTHKQLAHLTYARVTEYDSIDSRGWEITGINSDLNKVIEIFEQNLPLDIRPYFSKKYF